MRAATRRGLVDELGEHATAATPEDAARAADLVVASISFAAHQTLPAGALAGKTVRDTMNFHPDRDAPPPAELVVGTATETELVQRHLAGSRVVKVFNTIYYTH